MSDENDFLKREMASAIMATKRRRKFKYAGLFLCLLVCLVIVLSAAGDSAIVDDPSSGLAENSYDKSSSKEDSTNTPGSEPQQPTPPASPQSSSQASSAAVQPYTPTTSMIDRTAFIADANAIIANSGQIVSLLNFGASTPDSVKVDRINSAIALDKSSGDVTKLRGRVNSAGITNGAYMEAVELAESGVSTISVGVTFIGYWAKNHSRIDDLNLGLGNINEGSNTMLSLVQKINSL